LGAARVSRHLENFLKQRQLSEMMKNADTLLLKGTLLYERIYSFATSMDAYASEPKKLVLSFDLYCLLLEYSLLADHFQSNGAQSIEELFFYEDLMFDSGKFTLHINVDFFAPQESMTIR